MENNSYAPYGIDIADFNKHDLHLNSGDRFIAEDKLGRVYPYTYIGIQPDSFGYHIIHNEETGGSSHVELEWFHQRKIRLM